MPPSVVTAAWVLVAYLIGSLSGSLLLGRLRGLDIRQHGSGNAGATNALRAAGWRFALAVAAFDIAKGAFAAWLGLAHAPPGQAMSVTAHGYACGLAAMVGHVWPIWHGWRGGKGGATLVGVLLWLWPWVLPVVLLVWGGCVLLTGYVGLATVLAACALPVWAWFTDAEGPRLAFALAAAALVVFAHRGNLTRMRRGEESRFARARLLHRLRRGGGR